MMTKMRQKIEDRLRTFDSKPKNWAQIMMSKFPFKQIKGDYTVAGLESYEYSFYGEKRMDISFYGMGGVACIEFESSDARNGAANLLDEWGFLQAFKS